MNRDYHGYKLNEKNEKMKRPHFHWSIAPLRQHYNVQSQLNCIVKTLDKEKFYLKIHETEIDERLNYSVPFRGVSCALGKESDLNLKKK